MEKFNLAKVKNYSWHEIEKKMTPYYKGLLSGNCKP
jgi:hypothetical protein